MTLRSKTSSLFVAAAAAIAITLAFAAAPATYASSTVKSKTTHSKVAAKPAMYVCNTCEAYFTAAQAKKLGFKDQMGHKLVKVSKVPTGYTDGMKM